MARRCLRVTCQRHMKVALTPFFWVPKSFSNTHWPWIIFFCGFDGVFVRYLCSNSFPTYLEPKAMSMEFLGFQHEDFVIKFTHFEALRNEFSTWHTTCLLCNPGKFTNPHVQAIFQGFAMNVPQNITKSRWCSKPQYRNLLANPVFLGWGRFLHPGRLTWNIIMEVWKIIFLSKWVICRFQPLIFQGVNHMEKIAEKTSSARALKSALPASGRLQA